MTVQHRPDELIRILKAEFTTAAGVGSGSVTEGPGIDVIGSQVGLGGDTILQYQRNLNPVAEFAPTLAGITAAIAAAVSYDVILLPSVEIIGDVDLSAVSYVGLQGRGVSHSVIRGQLTYGTNCWLRQLSVRHEDTSASIISALISPFSGRGFAERCAFIATNNGAGNAYAVRCSNPGGIQHSNCDHQGLARGGGEGYGLVPGTGQVVINFGRLRGTTESIRE